MSDGPIEDLALGAFRLVKEKLAFELDFSPETLPVVDHFLITLREEEGGEPKENTLRLVGPCVGAYFGEVVRQSLFGLRWHHPRDEYKRWRLEGESVFLAFNPIGAALEAAVDEPLTGWNAHLTLLPEQREEVERALEATGPVREDDYHRLAIRHEVIEQTLHRLEAMEQVADARRSFGSDAYRAVLDEERAATEA